MMIYQPKTLLFFSGSLIVIAALILVIDINLLLAQSLNEPTRGREISKSDLSSVCSSLSWKSSPVNSDLSKFPCNCPACRGTSEVLES